MYTLPDYFQVTLNPLNIFCYSIILHENALVGHLTTFCYIKMMRVATSTSVKIKTEKNINTRIYSYVYMNVIYVQLSKDFTPVDSINFILQ